MSQYAEYKCNESGFSIAPLGLKNKHDCVLNALKATIVLKSTRRGV